MPSAYNGWPYPLGTEPVQDGNEAIQALAAEANQRLGGSMVQAGSSIVTLNSSGDGSITLGTPFAATPIYHVQVSGSYPYFISPTYDSATASWLTFRVCLLNGGNPGVGPVRIQWIAIGVAP